MAANVRACRQLNQPFVEDSMVQRRCCVSGCVSVQPFQPRQTRWKRDLNVGGFEKPH